jgi:hypothetical protein
LNSSIIAMPAAALGRACIASSAAAMSSADPEQHHRPDMPPLRVKNSSRRRSAK